MTTQARLPFPAIEPSCLFGNLQWAGPHHCAACAAEVERLLAKGHEVCVDVEGPANDGRPRWREWGER